MKSEIRIGMIGCGVVGTAVLRVLQDNAELISKRVGAPIKVVAIAVKEKNQKRDSVVPMELLHDESDSIVNAEEIDIVVELMGGVDPAESLLKTAIENKKHIVTANKALIAERGRALFELAAQHDVDIYFEAAVAGGIPIVRVLREALASDRIHALRGIVNGTSNYILSRMSQSGLEFSEALAEAQAAGYAEADPTLDVGGGDAQHKLAILAKLAFGCEIDVNAITTEGIDSLSSLDMEFAKRFGYTIKPLAIARQLDSGSLDLRVHPALIHQRDPLAHIDDALNAVHVYADKVGSCLLSGPGAGGAPTATSVVSDIIDIGRNILAESSTRVPSAAFVNKELKEASVQDPGILEHRFYLRFSVMDKSGVLASISGALGDAGVSIEQMIQDGGGPSAAGESSSIVMLTHEAREDALRQALRKIDAGSETIAPSYALRIED